MPSPAYRADHTPEPVQYRPQHSVIWHFDWQIETRQDNHLVDLVDHHADQDLPEQTVGVRLPGPHSCRARR